MTFTKPNFIIYKIYNNNNNNDDDNNTNNNNNNNNNNKQHASPCNTQHVSPKGRYSPSLPPKK